MKRLYYLTEELNSADSISKNIHEAGISDWNFLVVSKDESGLYKRHIHSANMIQKTGIVHFSEQGVLKGLAVGILLSLLLMPIPIHGSTPSMVILIFVLVASVMLGGFHGSLFGYQLENYKLKPFHHRIEKGDLLILIDVPKNQISDVQNLMHDTHPEARYCNQGSSIIMPFDKAKEVCY
ncbi:MAG: hypothetical protein KUG78_00525 [Kangiellaceae bacterium]|nr:hypothetical protein [Kangiellaceae bacterium]